ncbi:MAG: fluoride exporter [Solirubrobacteraceae bacterium]|nr:CrcB protein [Solirubrobacterales bacterium]MEA2215126.1 fluoride exporter [Solirubrobacteraceae bacterium]
MSFLALWAGVGAIGGAASVTRHLVYRVLSRGRSSRFASATLAVNVSGSLVLGLLVGAGVHGDAYLLAGTAAIGSYTTFSTWMLDTERLAEAGRAAWAVLNILASFALGIAAVELGRTIAGG